MRLPVTETPFTNNGTVRYSR